MRVHINNTSPVSRLKYFTLKALRPLSVFVTPAGEPWSNWDEEIFRDPQDSERCVEVPWVAYAMRSAFGLWLDVGFAHAEDRYWQALYATRKKLFRFGYGLDITLPSVPNPLPVFVEADLISDSLDPLPKFDAVTCISTLEHIGCDNKMYNPAFGRGPNPEQIQIAALKKMLSQLAPTGHLLLSLPYGKFQDNGWFLQYDGARVEALKKAAKDLSKDTVYEGYYRLDDARGWMRSQPEQMVDVLYRSDEKRAAGVVLLEFA